MNAKKAKAIRRAVKRLMLTEIEAATGIPPPKARLSNGYLQREYLKYQEITVAKSTTHRRRGKFYIHKSTGEIRAGGTATIIKVSPLSARGLYHQAKRNMQHGV